MSRSSQACCTGCSLPFCARPSIVVIFLPAASLAGSEQDRTAVPSISTVQAPHCAMPQPYLVPRQSHIFSDGPEERRVRFDVNVVRLSIDQKTDHHCLL